MVVLLFSPWLVWRLKLKADVRAGLETLRQAGVPLSEEERAAWFAQFGPPGTPTDLYGKAEIAYQLLPLDVVEHFPTFRSKNQEAYLFSRPYLPERLAAMEKALDLNEATMARLHEANELSRDAYFAGGSGSGASDDLIELYCAEACVRAAAGDGAGALASITGGLLYVERASAPYNTAPGWSTEDVERLLNALFSAASQTRLPDAGLEEICARLDTAGWEEQRRLRLSDATSRWIIDMQSFVPERQAVVMDVVSGYIDRYLLGECETWMFRNDLIGKPLAEQERLCDAFAEREGRNRQLRVSAPPVRLRVARVAIDILRCYQDRGRAPENLDELVPTYREALPDDFFSGDPIRYVKSDEGFAVYSVGRDKTDDGGDGRRDIVFRAGFPPEGEGKGGG